MAIPRDDRPYLDPAVLAAEAEQRQLADNMKEGMLKIAVDNIIAANTDGNKAVVSSHELAAFYAIDAEKASPDEREAGLRNIFGGRQSVDVVAEAVEGLKRFGVDVNTIMQKLNEAGITKVEPMTEADFRAAMAVRVQKTPAQRQ